MTDPFDLQRFVAAQAPVYQRVLAELRQGEKQSHWIWFVFPQLAGLGHSPMARRFAVASREEAVAYLGFASARRSSMRSRAEQFGKSSEVPTTSSSVHR